MAKTLWDELHTYGASVWDTRPLVVICILGDSKEPEVNTEATNTLFCIPALSSTTPPVDQEVPATRGQV